MRTTIILAFLVAVVTHTVYAGNSCHAPSPPKAKCGQKCVDKVLGQNKPRHCIQGDFKCYCTKPDFGYAIRDCARQHCPKASPAAHEMLEWGLGFCKSFQCPL